MSSLRLERTYSHSRAHVWRALTTPELLERWLMPNDFEPRVGHRFTFRTDPGPGFDGVVRCEVLELIEGERLSFTWVGGPIDTVVTFALSDVEDGTRLVVEQTGFRGLRAWIVSRILAIGSRTLYGKRLPALLDELEGGDPPAPSPRSGDDSACMTHEQSVWERLLAFLARRK